VVYSQSWRVLAGWALRDPSSSLATTSVTASYISLMMARSVISSFKPPRFNQLNIPSVLTGTCGKGQGACDSAGDAQGRQVVLRSDDLRSRPIPLRLEPRRRSRTHPLPLSPTTAREERRVASETVVSSFLGTWEHEQGEETGLAEGSYGFDPCAAEQWNNNSFNSYGVSCKEGDVIGVRTTNQPVEHADSVANRC